MMRNNNNQISSRVIKQILIIVTMIGLLGVIAYHLSMFIPSLLGAITLYVVFRKLNLYLVETKKWTSTWAAVSILFITLLIIVFPVYFTIESLVSSLDNVSLYIEKFNGVVSQAHVYVLEETGFNILSQGNVNKVKESFTSFSTKAVGTTFNTFSVIASMYFILYFMLKRSRDIETAIIGYLPFNEKNTLKIADKFNKMVIANAVGIPIVALGQGIVALIGYFIFGVENPILLFLLTTTTAMIPVVGSLLVYLPLCLLMIADGNTFSGVGLFVYCVVFVGLTDNIMRFTLLKKLENIHPLNTVFGIILGMNLFGFIGLVFGPILVSITFMLIKIYREEFGEKQVW